MAANRRRTVSEVAGNIGKCRTLLRGRFEGRLTFTGQSLRSWTGGQILPESQAAAMADL